MRISASSPRGLHPPLLAQRGLAAAVRAGAARSALPVELDLQVAEPLPDAVEAAAYYVCAEAVTNAVKHARASQAWVRIVHEPGTLTVEVRDDGVGGARVARDGEASGLSGLTDRVEQRDVQRLTALDALATLRRVSLRDLMASLGIPPPTDA